MSLIRLVSVVGFRWCSAKKEPIIVFGSDGARYDKTSSQWVFRAQNIPVDGRSGRLPSGGRTFFYGFHDAIKEIAYWQSVADRDGLYFHACYFDIEVGDIFTSLMSKDDVAGHSFASMRRFKTDLLDEILDFYRELTSRPSVSAKGMARYADVASTPWLLDDLMALDEFAGVNVMVYPVETGRGIKNVAFVRHGCKIAGMEQNLQQPWRIEP